MNAGMRMAIGNSCGRDKSNAHGKDKSNAHGNIYKIRELEIVRKVTRKGVYLYFILYVHYQVKNAFDCPSHRTVKHRPVQEQQTVKNASGSGENTMTCHK